MKTGTQSSIQHMVFLGVLQLIEILFVSEVRCYYPLDSLRPMFFKVFRFDCRIEIEFDSLKGIHFRTKSHILDDWIRRRLVLHKADLRFVVD